MPDRDVHRHVVAADRQDRGVERRAVGEQGEVDGPGADVGHRDPELLLGLGQDGLGRGQRVGDQLVDLHAGRDDALGEVLDRGRRAGDDVGLDLEPDRAHLERVLDPLLAVDDERRAAGRGGPRGSTGIETARATSVARLMSSRATSRP